MKRKRWRLNTVSFNTQDLVNTDLQIIKVIDFGSWSMPGPWSSINPEAMALDLQGLSRALEASLDPTQNKPGLPYLPLKLLQH